MMSGQQEKRQMRIHGRAAGWWLLWLVIFLPAVHWAERVARPAQLDTRSAVPYRLLDGAGQPVEAATPRQALRQTEEGYVVSDYAGARRIVFEVDFHTEADPDTTLGLYFTLREQILEIRLNGTVLQPAVNIPKLEGLLTSEPDFYRLPPQALRVGSNRLEIHKQLVGMDTALSPFSIAPAAALMETYRWRSFFVVDLGLISIGVQLFVLLLMALINWPAPDQPRIRALMAVIGCNVAGVYLLSFSPPVELSLAQLIYAWGCLNLVLGCAVVVYILRDGGWRLGTGRMPWVVLAGVLLLYTLATWLAPLDQDWALTTLLYATYGFVAVITLSATAALAYSVARHTPARRFERSVLALTFGGMALDRIGSMVDLTSPFDPSLPLTLSWLPILGTFLGLAMVIALAREAARARRVVQEANLQLARTLAQREAELEQSYQQQRAMERQAAVLEERQRLVRDMHDGIGGELLSLKLKADGGTLQGEALRQGIHTCLNDLRLIVDSLDCADDGVSATLLAFERRLRQQLAGTGISLSVDDRLPSVVPVLSPRQSLNLLRVLQEAVTNALAHGKASALQLRAWFVEADASFHVELQDNGAGMDTTAVARTGGGHGLRNMQQRAAASGGQLDLHSDAAGTRVHLRLPTAVAAVQG